MTDTSLGESVEDLPDEADKHYERLGNEKQATHSLADRQHMAQGRSLTPGQHNKNTMVIPSTCLILPAVCICLDSLTFTFMMFWWLFTFTDAFAI